MVKPRVQSADIASILGGAGRGGPGGRDAEAGSTMPAFGFAEGAHPVRDREEAGVARADNTLVLHPSRIVRRGRYVRPFTDDKPFRDLVTAIHEAGDVIHVPILVRIEGDPGAIEYVLVDGTHRLEAARRLNILLPALSLGRISAERALAVQAMTNEVRASMHVVDQATYIVALAMQGGAGAAGGGLGREAIQRMTGFSAGRVSELLAMGLLLDKLADADRARARCASRVTYRALRALKGTASTPDAFRAGVMALVSASGVDEADDRIPDREDAETEGEETGAIGVQADRVPRGAFSGLRSKSEGKSRGTAPNHGLTFVPTKNTRGTSITYRIAWRARAIRANPEAFLAHVGEVLGAIAAEATTQYTDALTRLPQRRATLAEAIERDEAELVEDRPEEGEIERVVVADRALGRGPADDVAKTEGHAPSDDAIDPRLLSGLSLPMLNRVIRESRRPPS
jgi:hypothetical protein